MKPENVVYNLVTNLKSCRMKRDLEWGRRIHAKATQSKNDANTYVVTALIKMYAKCSSMADACKLFDSMEKPEMLFWNALLLGYADNGQGVVALKVFSRMKTCSYVPDSVTYVAAIKACTSLVVNEDMEYGLERGREIHLEIGVHMDHYVQSTLIEMYSKCGRMAYARQVFDSIKNPNVVCWTALLSGYAENGEGHVALELFSRMKVSNCAPDSVAYVAALKACISLAVNGDGAAKKDCLERGRIIHSEIDCPLDNYLQNTLVDMYAKGGSMLEARRVFDSVRKPDVVCWTALLVGYAENGEGHAALNLFSKMKTRGCMPNSVTYAAVFKACTSLMVNDNGALLEKGREIHLEAGCHMSGYVQNTLIEMYAKSRSMSDARQLFDSIQKPDVVCWTTLIQGYAENGEGLVALQMFSRMKACGCAPDSITYLAALKACMSLAANGDKSGRENCLKCGREIHLEIGSHLDHYLQNALVDMYSKCGSMDDARRIFDSNQKPDVVCLTALLMGYAENGEGLVALDLFWKMKSRGFTPDSITYIAALKACTSLVVNGGDSGKADCLKWGRKIHSEIGCPLHDYVQSTLIDLYVKSGSMFEACCVFDSSPDPSVVSWTALLRGYADNGEGFVALDLFSKMKASGRAPDSVTYIAALKACTALNADDGGRADCLRRAKEIHYEIGCNLDHFVQNTLVDVYAKLGSMVDARCVFDAIQKPDVVSWNALLLGYADNGHGVTTLELLRRMKARAFVLDSVTYIAAVKACCLTGALALGRQFHSEMSEFTARAVTCLIDFYAKCGSMVEAREVFDFHSNARDVSTWNVLLAGYSSVDSDCLFNLFSAMQDEGPRPDANTFLSILLCCSHTGLVKKASEYFEAMPVRYGVTPTVMHYNCMVDVLGRGNLLSEAIAMFQRMPCNPDAVTWRALLGACHKWKNVEVGRLAFQSLVDVDASAYVLMAHVYGSRGMWEEQERMLETRIKW